MRHSLEEYDRRLTSLTQDSVSLAENMRSLANRLDEGDLTAPAWELVDELQFYRTRFLDLHSDICGTNSNPDVENARLAVLRDRLNQLREHDSLLTELDRLDAWRSPLASVTDRLQRLISAAKSGSLDVLRQAVDSLHQLRNLVSNADMSDAQWEAARETVDQNLGAEIAIAAIRGRLKFGAADASEVTSVELPNPELSADSFHLD